MKLTPHQRTLLALCTTLALLAVSTAEAAEAAVLDDCRQHGKNPLQVSSCLREAQIKADDALNAIVAQKRKQAKTPQALRDFDEHNQAWHSQRSRECQRRFAQEAPGSAAGEIRMACEIELTRQRLAEFASNKP